jgi:hypothetical protein
MRTHLVLSTVALALTLLLAPSVHSQGFASLWTVGVEDGTPNEFGSESYAPNNPPGSATVRDDDYYLAGTYPAPIGILAAPEIVGNFERALTSSDPNNRVHFHLTAAQAASVSRFRLSFRMLWGGWWDAVNQTSGPGFGTHHVVVRVNGQVLGTRTFTGDETMSIIFSAGQGAMVAGANRVEISRTGGSANAWIQFDYLLLEVDPTGLTDADNDGLPLWWERDSGLSDTNAADAAADSDADGSTNAQEFARGTDPRRADTDGDGLRDGVETNTGTFVSATDTGTNPLVADTGWRLTARWRRGRAGPADQSARDRHRWRWRT